MFRLKFNHLLSSFFVKMLRLCYYARRFDEKNRFGGKLAQLRLRLNRLLSSFFVKMLHLYYCARRFGEKKKLGGKLAQLRLELKSLTFEFLRQNEAVVFVQNLISQKNY